MTSRQAAPTLSPIHRTGLPGPQGALLFITVAVATLMLPLAVSVSAGSSPLSSSIAEVLALAALVLEGFCLVFRHGKAKGSVPLLAFVGFLLTLYTGSVLPAALLISLLIAVAEGAMLLAIADRRLLFLFPVLPLLTFGGATLLGGSVTYGIMGLFPYPPMVALALGTRNGAARTDGLSRVGIICLTSATTGISVIALTVYLLYTTYGACDLSILASLVDGFREQLLTTLHRMASEAGGPVAETLTPALIEDMVNSVFNLLPAYGVLACNLLAAFAQMILLSHLSAVNGPLCDRLRVFRISAVSSAVFILGYAVLLFAPSEDITSTVAENLVLILTPALAWAGVLHISFNLARKGKQAGCSPLLLLLTPCLLFIAPWIPAFYEAFYCVTAPFRFRKHPPSDET